MSEIGTVKKAVRAVAVLLFALLCLSLWRTSRPVTDESATPRASLDASAPAVVPAPPIAKATPLKSEVKAAEVPRPTDASARLTGVVFLKKDRTPVPEVRLRAMRAGLRQRSRGPGPFGSSGPPGPPDPAAPTAKVVSAVPASPTGPAGPPPAEALTGADGRYALTLASGTWELNVDDPDHRWSVSRSARDPLRKIDLAAGETRSVDVPLFRNRRMTGRITAVGGERIPPKSIEISLRGSQGRERFEVDDEGNFTLIMEDETNDRFRLEVSAEGYGKVVREVAWPPVP